MNTIDINILQVKLDEKNHKLYHLTFSNESTLSVHEDIMIKFALTKGKCLELAVIDDISNENQNYLAYLRAIKYLALKNRTTQQIATYLKQYEFETEHIDHALYRLIQEGYINDEQYAIDFVKFSSKAKSKGKNWVKQYLQQIGVSRQDIEVALQHYDDEQDLTTAIELATKKWPQLKGDDRVKKQKCSQFLLRKGFTGDIVRKALKSVEFNRFLDENLDIYT